ncbi:MAG TPA: sigma-70 family RNA polymerase sigma factor [Bacillota bacterium]|nr:sigma-70 family RNA polymerase sigma factor [Bacillota bacterium]HOL09862.1 sigma-70 family RNA polymerase sigma factor [Bacillota bacterium]HPO97578.1 sigma-70 family RNA polymerase sigma factor [Bacillota bacterium]
MNQQLDLELLMQIRQNQDELAMEKLVKKYLPMIRHIVNNQNILNDDYEDYLQEGAVGLLKAIEQYRPDDYRIKFSTFAYLCILRRIYNKIKQSYTKKSLLVSGSVSLNQTVYEESNRTLLNMMADYSNEPFTMVENDWIVERLNMVLMAYLSPLEYQVIQLLLNGFNLSEINKILNQPIKTIDNARTRARLKLKKVVIEYGSLLSPKIPMKTKKRKDIAINLKVV